MPGDISLLSSPRCAFLPLSLVGTAYSSESSALGGGDREGRHLVSLGVEESRLVRALVDFERGSCTVTESCCK